MINKQKSRDFQAIIADALWKHTHEVVDRLKDAQKHDSQLVALEIAKVASEIGRLHNKALDQRDDKAYKKGWVDGKENERKVLEGTFKQREAEVRERVENRRFDAYGNLLCKCENCDKKFKQVTNERILEIVEESRGNNYHNIGIGSLDYHEKSAVDAYVETLKSRLSQLKNQNETVS